MVSRLYLVVVKRGHAEIVHDVISNLSHTLIPFTHNIFYVLSYVLLCPLTTLRVIKIQKFYQDLVSALTSLPEGYHIWLKDQMRLSNIKIECCIQPNKTPVVISLF